MMHQYMCLYTFEHTNVMCVYIFMNINIYLYMHVHIFAYIYTDHTHTRIYRHIENNPGTVAESLST